MFVCVCVCIVSIFFIFGGPQIFFFWERKSQITKYKLWKKYDDNNDNDDNEKLMDKFIPSST